MTRFEEYSRKIHSIRVRSMSSLDLVLLHSNAKHMVLTMEIAKSVQLVKCTIVRKSYYWVLLNKKDGTAMITTEYRLC